LASPWPDTQPTAAHRAAYADATPRSFWLDTLPERVLHPPLEEAIDADLCIVGGGYTGLWAALYAKELDPGREVVLLEATRCGNGASGRNGGFLESSLTHGTSNGLTRFPDEIETIERLGRENFEGLARDIEELGIDAELERTGDLVVALEPRQVDDLVEEAELMGRFGHQVELLDGEQVRAQITSKKFIGALWTGTGSALVNPGRLADGLRAAAARAGVRIHEHSPARELRDRVSVITDGGVVRARGVVLATSAYPPLVPTIRRYVAPVYDYALVTEPVDLSAVGPQLDDHEPTFARLSQHFFTVFPQLEGVRFSHRWGGAIDTCSRFSVFFGRALGGRVAYALGYTGLGVGASRFGGRVALDLLDGRTSEATALAMVRRRPVPFPPEPLRSAVIQLTRNRLAAADRNDGHRGLWLTALDRLGLGFDS
jgi:glycine/D-amino acid oxidase-like deaminating enzyme